MSYGKRYAGDPRWITAKFGTCAKCGKPLAGKPAIYFPNGKTCFCEECGRPEMAVFESAAFDEAVMTNQW
ncbi:MAG: hypothetical protein WCS01_15460 [bacterium]